MATDWEEVKRLAADFQRAQLSSSIQKLSERNCIEIVSKLIELKLLDVVFSTDGKEFITPQQISREIRDELYINGGRVNLVDVAQNLNLDLSHVESRAADLVRHDTGVNLVLGQLVERSYLDQLAEEVNEKLQQSGEINIGELTKLHDLPTDFLDEEIGLRLGSIIQGRRDEHDPRTIFTEAHVARNRSRVRGLLSAVTRPTLLAPLCATYGIKERLFLSVAEKLIASKRVAGTLIGGRQASQATYIPDVYTKAQTEWTGNFYQQNGYLEYDALSRLGVSDPQGFIKRRYRDSTSQLTFLRTCCVGGLLKEQITAAVDEALASGVWTDIMPLVPSVLSAEDVHQLLDEVLASRGRHQSAGSVFADTVVISNQLLDKLKAALEAGMEDRAKHDISKGLYKPRQTEMRGGGGSKSTRGGEVEEEGRKEKKEERRKKAAGGKAGGGTQGRETKTKSVKKKYLRGSKVGAAADDSDNDGEVGVGGTQRQQLAVELIYLTSDQLRDFLARQQALAECPEDVIEEMVDYLERPLTNTYQEALLKQYQLAMTSSVDSRRRTHHDMQEKLSGLLTNIRLFCRGIEVFPPSVQQDTAALLSKHLLKTLGTDVLSEALLYLVGEHDIEGVDQDKELTAEARIKVINKLPEEMKEPLMKLHKTLSGANTDEFLSAVNTVLGPGVCDVVVRKADKKKERQLVFGHRHSLLEQLSATSDPPLVLHLVLLVLFQTLTGAVLHASGRFVPQILSALRHKLPDDTCALLEEYQRLVLKLTKLASSDSEERSEVQKCLEEMTNKVKELAVTTKKLKPAGSQEIEG